MPCFRKNTMLRKLEKINLRKYRKMLSKPLVVTGLVVVVVHELHIMSVCIHHFITSFAQNPVKIVTPVSKLRQSLVRSSAKLVEKLMGNSGSSSSSRLDANSASDSSNRWENLSRFVDILWLRQTQQGGLLSILEPLPFDVALWSMTFWQAVASFDFVVPRALQGKFYCCLNVIVGLECYCWALTKRTFNPRAQWWPHLCGPLWLEKCRNRTRQILSKLSRCFLETKLQIRKDADL